MNRANIYIAPLFVGSGIRIKILEAMAMELPVVATPVSAEGIAGSEAVGLFICKNAEEFAQSIIGLCSDYKLTRELGSRARNFIIDNFSWEKNVGKMIEFYRTKC